MQECGQVDGRGNGCCRKGIDQPCGKGIDRLHIKDIQKKNIN